MIDEFFIRDEAIAVAIQEPGKLGELSLVEKNTNVAEKLRKLVFQADLAVAIIVGDSEQTAKALHANRPSRLDFFTDAL
jgi:hypothetical protein